MHWMRRGVCVLGLALAGCFTEFPEFAPDAGGSPAVDAMAADVGDGPARDAVARRDAAEPDGLFAADLGAVGPIADAGLDAPADGDAADASTVDARVDAAPDAAADAALMPDAGPPRRHPTWCQELLDNGADGRIEAVTTRVLDETDRIQHDDLDDDNDGAIDRRVTYIWRDDRVASLVVDRLIPTPRTETRVDYFYDAIGRAERVTWDERGDGRVDAVWTWEYEAPDRYVRRVDDPAGGSPELRYRVDLVPGEPTTWRHRRDRFDDVVTEVQLDIYGPNGMALVEIYQPPETLAGRHTYEYDIPGNLSRVVIDRPVGRGIERVHAYTYDCFR